MEDPLPPDPYKALGIAKDAPLAAVRSAHRKLVLTCHPDKVADESAKKPAADKFHLVQQAYEILSDETRRQRYDERIKLADLRADVMSQKGGRMIPEMAPRTKTTTFEMRGGRMYEERAPRRAYEEDDYFQPRYEPRYEEVRPRRHDDRSFPQSPRKTSGRASEEKRRAKEMAREAEEDRDRRSKDAARADERAARSERNKRRDKDRRHNSEVKSRSKNPYTEDHSDSDSDVTERISSRREDPARRRYGGDLRKPELPRRSTTREVYDVNDDYDTKHTHAQDYIARSRGSVEPETRRPPPPSRSYTHVDARPPLTPKAPPGPIDTSARRSSGRGSSRRDPSPPPRLSRNDRRMTEIVEPPASIRRPSLPIYSSDPNGLRVPMTPGRKEPHRSQTLDSVPEKKPPSVKRAETMPTEGMRRSENQPSKSSKLKEQHDSGYSSRSSRGTPELSPTEGPQFKTTKYKYGEHKYDSTGSEDEITVVPEHDSGHRSVREASPKARRPPMTPQSASRMQMPPMRSGSFAMPPDQPPTPRTAPPLIRTESGRPPPSRARPSARGGPALYGEVSPSDDLPYRVLNQSPRISRDDIRYSPRRGSDDVDRDAYPGSHHHPGFSRSDSRAVHT